jgi:hypothetical protein
MNRILIPSIFLAIAGHLLTALASQATSLGGTLLVESVTPARHLVGALPQDPIRVSFDRAVDPASVSTQSFWAFARWCGDRDA